MRDRVGLGWRGEIGASILERLDAIDIFEVIAEDWLNAPAREQRALRALSRERPVLLHGVAMGMASSVPVDERRLERMARLVGAVEPSAWSEHLAFVRGGGVEIGHLAAPPRTEATVEGAIANLRRVGELVGRLPAMENIATLIDPPASAMDETTWTCAIVRGAGAPMLIDLHNLYANAVNFGEDPRAMLERMPLDRVSMVHLSGGRWVHPRGATPRLLDDHLHDVPDPVFGLLENLAARVPRPLDVILERDGNYPAFSVLADQLQRARNALRAGRAEPRERRAA
jgi:uncharacterized protein (UPF0276 family)